MNAKGKWTVVGLGAIALFAWALNAASATAQMTKTKEKEGREVTMTGRIVDLHCFMTGEYVSTDHTKCTADCIHAGVPAGLETDKDLIVLGQGMKSAAKTIAPFAFEKVEVKGKLFEKMGVQYLDITSIQKEAQTKP